MNGIEREGTVAGEGNRILVQPERGGERERERERAKREGNTTPGQQPAPHPYYRTTTHHTTTYHITPTRPVPYCPLRYPTWTLSRIFASNRPHTPFPPALAAEPSAPAPPPTRDAFLSRCFRSRHSTPEGEWATGWVHVRHGGKKNSTYFAKVGASVKLSTTA